VLSLFLPGFLGTSVPDVRVRKLAATPRIAAGRREVITGLW
jgi:hypothetical protein